MELNTNEKIILSSDDGHIILTNMRIRQEIENAGSMHLKSILLPHVTSCEYIKESKPLLLVLGILCIISGLYMHQEQEVLFGGLLIGIMLVLLFLSSLKKQLVIASPTSKISINSSGFKTEAILAFVDKLEAASINAKHPI